MIKPSTFENYYRKKRKDIPAETEIMYEAFASYKVEVGGKTIPITDCDEEYFSQHASEIIIDVRKLAFEKYLEYEHEFTNNMHYYLVNKYISKPEKDLEENIKSFLEEVREHIFMLAKSTTNSRRSRAGDGFETIIELVLTGSGIRLDSQAELGDDYLKKDVQTKSIDFVVPSVCEFDINPRNCMPISAKTTLRERWSQVGEELNRIGGESIFLVTLDSKVARNKFYDMDKNHIRLVTTMEQYQVYQEKFSKPASEEIKKVRNLLSIEKMIERLKIIQNECEKENMNDKKNVEAVLCSLTNRRKYHEALKHYFMCTKLDSQISRIVSYMDKAK